MKKNNNTLILTGLFALAKTHYDALQDVERAIRLEAGLGLDPSGYVTDSIYGVTTIDPVESAKHIQKVAAKK